MCIRDRVKGIIDEDSFFEIHKDYAENIIVGFARIAGRSLGCLLYTSDAADERSSVDLGGRRIIKKQNNPH